MASALQRKPTNQIFKNNAAGQYHLGLSTSREDNGATLVTSRRSRSTDVTFTGSNDIWALGRATCIATGTGRFSPRSCTPRCRRRDLG